MSDLEISISETIKVRESLGLKKFAKGSKDFLAHLKQGWFPSGDTVRHPDGVQLTQNVDRENDLYTKKVIDEKTGAAKP